VTESIVLLKAAVIFLILTGTPVASASGTTATTVGLGAVTPKLLPGAGADTPDAPLPPHPANNATNPNSNEAINHCTGLLNHSSFFILFSAFCLKRTGPIR
jgi:hypothetical protein